ncbi:MULTISPECIES: branched-chain amino acid transport system II carrier protein [Oceanobacillus]|uniref:Branched-chain amino acid transport system carrier protein n=1 Tax=Oceanobacillus jordanicus TaxID=2867266 RepID=A0AAW5B6L7_9BACI|nr:branched-chain amino acid transport system II carrier protein [Oceanobacillus jordanicus]MCG3419174.1 branched-chain amino acid transport system II carrier protein [Oceanobacillus jordanicus]
MKDKLSFSSYAVVGFMLFALFFGAGNLIFPAQLGQNAGTNFWPAVLGFLLTGVGLPLLGILAMSYSGSKNLQELASRIHPAFGITFTVMLYLTIGPFFAAPRTATVAYDVGFSSFISEGSQQTGLLIFTLLFFLATLFFSLKPGKLIDYIGKLLAPSIVVLLLILLVMVIAKPMGEIQEPLGDFQGNAFVQGFLEGYNTMDALASLVFGIIVIKTIRSLGVTSTKGVLAATARSGLVAITLLGVIYVGIAYLGAVSIQELGVFTTGGPVLSGGAAYYFGQTGTILLAVILTLACLTTSIGLTTACAEYFQTLFPKVGYKAFAIFFTGITFIIANFGLANIITYSVPVLMLLYPLAIVLMLLAFLSGFFQHKRVVYAITIAVTFLISVTDGLKSLCNSLGIEYFDWLTPILSFYEKVLPLYNQGLGWLLPALVIVLIASVALRGFHVTAKTSVK